MIDLNLPLELDNGLRVELQYHYDNTVGVLVPFSAKRDGDARYVNTTWRYSLVTGVFGGDYNNSFYTIRNVDDEADYIEDLI